MHPDDVVDFWFGELDEDGVASDEASERWWKKDAAFDREVEGRFSALHHEIMAGGREDWLNSPRGRLAYVIVLDQFSRNMFRDRPESFASDARALRAAVEGLDSGEDRELPFHPRSFFFMPLMHSEDLADQERCVALFTALRDEQEDQRVRDIAAYGLDFAVRHRDIVARFGRFPHRNAVLGRDSTPEELAFLEQPGSSF